MKKWIILMLALALLLTACGGGDVSEAGRRISGSQRFDESEVADAMDVVEDYFRKNFDGCRLHTIIYDEEADARLTELAAGQYGENTIILKTDFRVEDAGDGSWTPDMEYKNYTWTLTKTFWGWRIQDHGYA